MSQTTLHIKTDQEIKEKAEKFAKSNGITLTALVNLSLRQVLNTGQITLQEQLAPNAKTGKILKEALADYKAGRNIYKFNDIEDAIKHLHLENV